jgi:2-polyprenyl-6-methoxyphenol hydroxylase-like FAD-dependent oxidoreductase
MPNPILKQAVVIGAGMGGLAAAKAVAPHFEKVIVFDRDALPDEPAPRSGTPQARHTHGLLAGGHRALDRLFPGIELDFIAAGAVRVRQRRDARYEVPGFDPLPQRDLGFDQFLLSRPALELVCRRRVEREPNIEFRSRTRVTALIASPDNGSAAGVRFEDTRGTLGSVAADLVVDASGRASPTLGFLEAIGSSKPAAIEIGIDQAYATTVFETPDDAPTDWLGVLHQPTPPGSSRLGLVMPMEGSRWSVSLCVNHGETPPSDIDGFMAFAKSLRMPTIYNAIRSAKRVGDIARFGMPCSVRRAFDKLDRFPRGLVPLGDSVCRFPRLRARGCPWRRRRLTFSRASLSRDGEPSIRSGGLRNRSSLKSSRFSKLHGPSPWPISSIRRRAASGRQILKRSFNTRARSCASRRRTPRRTGSSPRCARSSGRGVRCASPSLQAGSCPMAPA